MKKTLFLLLLLFTLPILSTSFADVESDEIKEFENWATHHGINLVGVDKNAHHLYYSGFDSKTDSVDWKTIPGVLSVADSLYKIPDNVIQVMSGKTIYFSTEQGRSYTVLGSFPDYGILVGLDRGIIIEQNIRPYVAIHEIGHIVDFHGIRGMYDDSQNHFTHTSALRDSIFKVDVAYHPNLSNPPSGHVSVYSTVNDAENFAESFAYFVEKPEHFRAQILTDPELIEEYEFLRDEIFNNFEY